jgi:hypothetical protein
VRSSTDRPMLKWHKRVPRGQVSAPVRHGLVWVAVEGVIKEGIGPVKMQKERLRRFFCWKIGWSQFKAWADSGRRMKIRRRIESRDAFWASAASLSFRARLRLRARNDFGQIGSFGKKGFFDQWVIRKHPMGRMNPSSATHAFSSPDGQHRAGGIQDHKLGRGSHEELPDLGATLDAHHDLLDIVFLGEIDQVLP